MVAAANNPSKSSLQTLSEALGAMSVVLIAAFISGVVTLPHPEKKAMVSKKSPTGVTLKQGIHVGVVSACSLFHPEITVLHGVLGRTPPLERGVVCD